MQDIRLALVGFGNVAQGLTQILAEKGAQYEEEFDLRFHIVAISDPVKGTIFNPDGLDPKKLLAVAQQPGGLNQLDGEHPGWEALEMIQNSPADVLVELSYTNLTTGEPAKTYLTEALRRQMHVITTNKGPIALHYDALAELARIQDLRIGVEGTVMSGTPCLRMGRRLLAPAGITKIEGILNGTTNYILTQMESGKSYADALAEAQAQGYAEADPTGDVEGFDAAAKVAILGRLVLGAPVTMANVQRTGISQLTLEEVQRARQEGHHWKLIGSLEVGKDGVKASVSPQSISDDHPLARVSGVTNAIRFSTDLLGDVTLVGPGAGRMQTGYAIIQDLLHIFIDECP